MEPKRRLPPKNSMDPLLGRTNVIDTETTGTNPKTDRVISFGCVTLENGKIVKSVELFFNPGDTPIDPDAERVHGLSMQFLADKPPIKKHLADILGMLAEAVLCGHNLKFDADFLEAELRRHNFPTLEQFILGYYCTLQESKRRWPGKVASLDALCARAGVSTAHRNRHGALIDAQLCADALIAMHREQRELLDNNVGSFLGAPATQDPEALGPMPAVIVLPAAPDEIAAHETVLLGMKAAGVEPIWRGYATPVSAADCTAHDQPDEEATCMAPA